jgi:hypothetical protein
VLARAHQNVIWTRNRHTNALRAALREYDPAAPEAFDNLADREALAILGRATDPRQAAGLGMTNTRSTLKTAGQQRNIGTRAIEIQAALLPEQLAAPGAVTAAFAATTRATVGVIVELNRQIEDLETLTRILRCTRTPTPSVPCRDLVSSSAPSCSVSSGTKPGMSNSDVRSGFVA